MYCIYCGKKISNDSLFCIYCGKKLNDNGFNFNYFSDEFVYIRNTNYDIRTIKRCLTILKDCADLINTTKKPKVFFERYLLAISIINELIIVEKRNKKLFAGSKPTTIKKQFIEKEILTVNDFIDRYYTDILFQMSKLKTSKAKNMRIDDFCNGLNNYKKYLRINSLEHYTKLCTLLMNRYRVNRQ